MSELSTKPYLLRAIHEWCTDSGYTPYIAVAVDQNTIVPQEFVRAGEIVLNVSMSATHRLIIGSDLIEFQARFNGRAQDLSIPIDNVSAIYARENGHGMAFEVAKPLALVPAEGPDDEIGAPVDAEAKAGNAIGADTDTETNAGTEPDAGDGNVAPATDTAPPTPEPQGASPRHPGSAHGRPVDGRPSLSVAGSGARARPRLAAVPDRPRQTPDDASAESNAAPATGTQPDDDPPAPITDNGGDRPGKPRGKPTLTRVK